MSSEVSQNLPRWFERILAVDSFNSNQYILTLKPDTIIEMLKNGAQQTYRLYFRLDKKNKSQATLWYKFGKNSFRRRMRLNIEEHEKGTKIIAEYKLSSISTILIIAFWVLVLLMTSMFACVSIASVFFPQEGISSADSIERLFEPLIPIGSLSLFFQLARGFAYLETSKTKESFNSIFQDYIVEAREV